MSTKLDEILTVTRRNLTAAKSAGRVRELERRASEHRPRGFKKALAERAKTGSAIIAELKKASPSKGLIRESFDPISLAKELEAAGAAALSVLTDVPHFQGSLENLEKASAAVEIPCLRKDFIVDPVQIVEARAFGADAILLIVAALEDQELRDLRGEARNLGLDVLCEVHERDELKRAANLGFDLIGVNNRDLRTLEVDVENAFRFREEFPPNAVRVAESGIENRETIARLREAGYHAFLVGERLMRAELPGAALRELLS
jgi:indole-3-glycerol phosphate synthase